MLDGVFSFCLLDHRLVSVNQMFVARDPYGVRPLYLMKPTYGYKKLKQRKIHYGK